MGWFNFKNQKKFLKTSLFYEVSLSDRIIFYAELSRIMLILKSKEVSFNMTFGIKNTPFIPNNANCKDNTSHVCVVK